MTHTSLSRSGVVAAMSVAMVLLSCSKKADTENSGATKLVADGVEGSDVAKAPPSSLPPKTHNAALHDIELRFVVGPFEKVQYARADGSIAIEGPFLDADDFSEGVAVVRTERSACFYIDSTGGRINDFNYAVCGPFHEGLAVARRDSKSIVLDVQGGEREMPYRAARWGVSQDLLAYTASERVGFMTPQGKVHIEAVYTDVGSFSEGLAWVATGESPVKKGFIDRTGNVVIEPRFDDVTDFSGGTAGVEIERKWGLIDKHGEVLLVPTYETLLGCKEGICVVDAEPSSIDNRSTYVDVSGKRLTDELYFVAAAFSDSGLAYVCKVIKGRGKCGFIDRQFKLRIPLIFTSVTHRQDGMEFRDGVMSLYVGDDRFLISSKGEFVATVPKGMKRRFWVK